MKLEYVILAFQIVILLIVSGSVLSALRIRRHTAKTLEAIQGYRREINWFEARLDALEKKNTEKNWQVIEGRSNGQRPS